MTPKFHMFQHVYLQFEHDCAPRYSYCFAEESKNGHMSELAKRAANHGSLPERTMIMHELWAGSECPTVAKIRVKRRASAHALEGCKNARVDLAVGPDSDVDLAIGSDADLEI